MVSKSRSSVQRAAGRDGGGFFTFGLGAAAACAPVRHRKRPVCRTLLLIVFTVVALQLRGMAYAGSTERGAAAPTLALATARRGFHPLCRGSLPPASATCGSLEEWSSRCHGAVTSAFWADGKL